MSERHRKSQGVPSLCRVESVSFLTPRRLSHKSPTSRFLVVGHEWSDACWFHNLAVKHPESVRIEPRLLMKLNTRTTVARGVYINIYIYLFPRLSLRLHLPETHLERKQRRRRKGRVGLALVSSVGKKGGFWSTNRGCLKGPCSHRHASFLDWFFILQSPWHRRGQRVPRACARRTRTPELVQGIDPSIPRREFVRDRIIEAMSFRILFCFHYFFLSQSLFFTRINRVRVKSRWNDLQESSFEIFENLFYERMRFEAIWNLKIAEKSDRTINVPFSPSNLFTFVFVQTCCNINDNHSRSLIDPY